MKNYYHSLSKEEKGKIKEQFLNSKECTIYKKAERIFNICIFGIIFAIMAFVFDYSYHNGIFNYLTDLFLFILCLGVLLKMNKYKDGELNRYALKQKK